MTGFVTNNQGVLTASGDYPFAVNNQGTIKPNANDIMIMDQTVSSPAGSPGLVEIVNTATLQFKAAITNNTVKFDGGAGTVIFDQPGFIGAGVTISGLTAGDQIQIPGLPAGAVRNYSSSTGVLTIKSSALPNASILGTVAFAGPNFPAPAVVANGVTQCFAAGTQIATPAGRRPVESLTPGGCVVLADGGTGTIQWAGHRAIDIARHPEPGKVRPYRVAAHAFGRGTPRRDLFLSPDHAIFADGVLIPVKFLDNGTTIRQIAVRAVVYYHFELQEHAVVLAEGLPVESLLAGAVKTRFSAGSGVTELHPDFSAVNWEAMGCAPLVVVGPKLDAVRRDLDRHAAGRRSRRAAG